MTARRPIPGPIKVIISASLLVVSGGVLSFASCFGALATLNRSNGAGFWGVLVFIGLGFVALGVLLFVGIGLWGAIALLTGRARRARVETL